MTIVEYMKCIRKYWVVVVTIPLVFALVAVLTTISLSSSGSTYSATAVIYVNYSYSQFLTGVTSEKAKDAIANSADMKAYVEGDHNNSTVTIRVTGPNPEQVESMANEIATQSLAEVKEDLAESTTGEAAYAALPFLANVDEAKSSEIDQGGFGKLAQYGIAAALIGLFFSIVAVFFLVAYRKPVIDENTLAEEFEVPLLGSMSMKPEAFSRYLEEIILLTDATERTSFCVMPVSSGEGAAMVCRRFEETLEHAKLPRPRFRTCGAIRESASDTLDAKDADAVILVVREWEDSVPDVRDAMNLLKMIHAYTISIMLVQ